MSAYITELSCYAEEELVLLAHGLVRVTGIASNLHSLQLHIRVRDFGYLREVEDNGKQEDEASDPKVCPLHLGNVGLVSRGKEYTRGQERSDNAAGCLKALSSKRNSESLGGSQVAMKGFAEASRVERPEPTMKREPQNPPNER